MEPISTTYAIARSRFIEVATAAGANLSSYSHPNRGREGEDLAIDVASLGPEDAESVLIVVSATHGVEGYAGSALQIEMLNSTAKDRPTNVRLVVIHAFNPYGFSWVRRVNEDNVDLNRNFIDWSGPLPDSSAYDEIASLLVPQTWTTESQESTFASLLGYMEEHGMEHAQTAISGGQYIDKTGIFYGGTGPVWSHKWLQGWARGELSGTKNVAILDLHTGLGEWGTAQFIGTASPNSPEHQRAVEWWGDVVAMGAEDSVSAALSGDWLSNVGDMFPGAETTAMAIEYGTVDVVSVLQALRADAQLHAYGDPTAPEAADTRTQVRAAFCDDDPKWAEAIWAPFETSVVAAFKHLGSAD